MLKSLKLQGIGPVSNLAAQFGNRLNVLTGDNGLGKSFLLDVCFWALTGTWPGGRTAIPEAAGTANPAPSISFELATGRAKSRTAEYIYQSQAWATEAWAPAPALVLYAAVDGSFSVWDYARNDWPTSLLLARGLHLSKEKPEPLAYQFSSEAVAEGLKDGDRVLCNGLIQDWVTWYYQRSRNGSDN
ncbi:MAG: AAA family ATPase, partial [Blastocatellia bacterium]